jgi:hypothetical protein
MSLMENHTSFYEYLLIYSVILILNIAFPLPFYCSGKLRKKNELIGLFLTICFVINEVLVRPDSYDNDC